MKTKSAIKKLEKNGFRVGVEKRMETTRVSAWIGEHQIAFFCQNGEAVCITSDDQWQRDNHAPQYDNFCKSHHDNMSQAIKWVERKNS